MTVETLKDILMWTKHCHDQLSACLARCAQENQNKRASMVLEYLAHHELVISAVLKGFEDNAEASALNTWCYNYLDRDTPKLHQELTCTEPFVNKSADEIVSIVEEQHNMIIDIYRYLADKVETPSAAELAKQLLELEKHEAMRMNQNTNRFQDL